MIRPLPNKSARATVEAMQSILQEIRPIYPKIIYSDRGSEFRSVFEAFCRANAILQFRSQGGPQKAALAESKIRQFKVIAYR